MSILNCLFIFLHSDCLFCHLEGSTGDVENHKKKAVNNLGLASKRARMIANVSQAACKF